MRRSFFGIVLVTGFGLGALAAAPGCGGSSGGNFFIGDGGVLLGPDGARIGTGGGGVVPLPDGSVGSLGGGTGTGSSGGHPVGADGGVVCPPGLQCNVTCTGGGTTTITGKVYDPAGKDPLLGVAVYVPAVPLTPLPKGVPTGADACSCGALFPSGAVTNTTTAVDGSFTLKNVPVGSAVPLVLQVGKWRRSLTVPVTACTDNAQMPKSLTLPGTIAAGDTDNNMPDLAVSTGSADTLECLLLRIGVSASEYVPGTSTAGHVHIFSGGGAGTGVAVAGRERRRRSRWQGHLRARRASGRARAS
jgi:hypothetical protein